MRSPAARRSATPRRSARSATRSRAPRSSPSSPARSRATSPTRRPTRCTCRRATTAASSASSTWPGTPPTACRCGSRSSRAGRARPRDRRDGAQRPVDRRDQPRARARRAVRRHLRRDPEQRRRPEGLHGARVAAPQRRPLRRVRPGLGRRPRRAAAVRDLPARVEHGREIGAPERNAPSIGAISHALARAAQFAVISGAIPSNVADQKAYTVHVSPRHNGGLFGEFDLAWDAAHGVPLRFAIFPRGSSTAAISVSVTHIRYGSVPASALSATPPAGTRIVRVHMPDRHDRAAAHKPHVTTAVGQAAASKAVGFTVAAPETLAGLPQHRVRAIVVGSHRAALVTYGRGLGTVFVLEQRKTDAKTPLSALPSVTVNGIRAHELDTTLGSVIQWSRGGVTYTIAGSQSAERIMSAAKSLT